MSDTHHFLKMSCVYWFCNVKYTYGGIMQTTVTKRGQTVIPAAIRRRYQIQEGDQLIWIDDGQTIKVVPVPADPIAALRARGKGEGLVGKLLFERQKEIERDVQPLYP
jgi:AbrB family looped-hinge helix DNA binding protein